jgi:aspartate/methionine/tyrosine aminotransferase
MSGSRAPYMEWAKTRPKPEIDLAGSNLLACTLDDLPGARDAVDIEGESPEGYPPLLEAIARHHGVTPERVATAAGCSGATFLACAAILSPGDDVLVETPGYDPLPGAARLLGARVRPFERRFEDGYALDPDAVADALTPATRLVMISNPHNPSGALAAPESLARLANLAEALGFYVLVDEVYRDTVFEDRPDPAAVHSPHVISTSSLTKAYGLASLRCGWALASPEIVEAIRRARDVVDVWSPMPADRLSVVAFRHIDRLARRTRGIVEVNRAAIGRFLAACPALRAAPSRSTLVFPRLERTDDAGPFVERLFRDTGIAVAPGRFFGAPAHFRLAFGGDPAALQRGLEALERALSVL